jgi:hypothetical protein
VETWICKTRYEHPCKLYGGIPAADGFANPCLHPLFKAKNLLAMPCSPLGKTVKACVED